MTQECGAVAALRRVSSATKCGNRAASQIQNPTKITFPDTTGAASSYEFGGARRTVQLQPMRRYAASSNVILWSLKDP